MQSEKIRKPNLNSAKEAVVCFLILCCVAVYSLLYIVQESDGENDVINTKKNRQLAPGWRLMSRKQDVADFEWLFWFSEARETLISLILGHLIVSLTAHYFFPQRKRDCLFVYGIAVIFWLFGPVVIVWLTSMCLLYFLVLKRSSSLSIISCTLGLLVAIQQLPLAKYNFVLSEMDYSLLVKSGLSCAVFRCCSFTLEAIRQPSDPPSFYNLMQYNFYIPYFFFGPVMTFDAFKNQNNRISSASVISFFKEAFTTFVFIVLVDFSRHFLHVSSLPHDSEFMTNAPLTVIGFLAFSNFYLDWIKGRILYSVSSGISRNVDGYVDAPVCCKNVATIHTFADTYFDRGLQQFVCRYAYDYLSKTHQILSEEAIAGAVSFLIVIASQGVTYQLSVWAFLNWFGLTLEFYLVKLFGNSLEKKTHAVLFGLNYWCIVLFNCIAINGILPFQLYFRRLFLDGGVLGITQTIVIGYCYTRIVFYFKNRNKNEKKD